MKKKVVVVIDSGAGGLCILKECFSLVKNYDFVYVADKLNSPYGNTPARVIRKNSVNLFDLLCEKFDVEFFVLACNTLTTNAIDYLRKKYKQVIIGTEPPLKQAKMYVGSILFFATKNTIKQFRKLDKKTNEQLKIDYKQQNLKFYKGEKVYKKYIKNLPRVIDENLDNLDKIIPFLENEFNGTQETTAENIVLGCTHYVLIKEQLKKVLGEDKEFFDNSLAVAKRLKSFCSPSKKNTKKMVNGLNKKNKINEDKIKEEKILDLDKRLKFVVTNGDDVFRKSIKNLFVKIYTEDTVLQKSLL